MHAFRYEPDAGRIEDLQRRLAHAHRVPLAPDPGGQLGIAAADLTRLAAGLAAFDWPRFAARVNRWPAYRVSQAAEQVHFVHVPSATRAAVPLLLLHGWPGSFLEFQEVIAPLTEGTPAFHIVCPSLPGYGFSTRDPERSCNAAAIADTMAELMQRLGYTRFLVQGGDWGSVVAGELARRHPARCLGLHLNLAALRPPPADDPARAAVLPEEAAWLTAQAQLWADGMGYYAIQSTRP
ncbi:MAG TPA: epoxide hydrolase, partial [Steroidobacteraceae bacterium]|nr:epoxide hydrolase [Steroidobacteraceae bacterium]